MGGQPDSGESARWLNFPRPLSSRSGSDGRAGKRSEGADDFVGGHKGAGVVWDVDFERGVHVRIGVACGCVFHQRDLIAEFRGIANRGLHTGVSDQPNTTISF